MGIGGSSDHFELKGGSAADAFDRAPEIRYLPARNEVVHAFASHDKARRAFASSDPLPLRDGIRRMSEWAKRVGPRPSPVFGGVEVWRNMPEAWRGIVADAEA